LRKARGDTAFERFKKKLLKGLTVPIEECTLVNALEEDKTTPNAPNLDKLIV
jgi:hypothetical protein